MTIKSRLERLEQAVGPDPDAAPRESLFDRARRYADWYARYRRGEVRLEDLPPNLRESAQELKARCELDRRSEAGPGEEPPCP
jgi:hypothetical protein